MTLAYIHILLVVSLFHIANSFHINLQLLREKRDVKAEDVKLYLFTKDTENKFLNDQPNDSVDGSKPTAFIIHGYTQNPNQPYFKAITDAFLKNDEEYNVIHVNWERPAKLFYISSAKNTRHVGNILAEFIVNHNLDLQKIHIVGHSLGSHVSGFTGKKIKEITGQKVHRITGIDPAGPYFTETFITPDDRLSEDDAEIVVAIHTDYNLYGYKNPIGTFDIYVNGGDSKQPYCIKNNVFKKSGPLESTICHHMLACDYFAEFVNNKFKCKMCNSLEDYSNDGCISGNELNVSSNEVTKETTGICFAKTNDTPPFL